jgi:hypothetical protein
VGVADELTYQSTVGAIVCWLVLIGALVTAGQAGRATMLGALGAGLALAAAVPMLVLILVGAPDESPLWTTAVPAVLLVTALLAWRAQWQGPLLVAMVMEAAVFGYFGTSSDAMRSLADWILYALAAFAAASVTAVGAGVAAGLKDAAELPLLAPMVTAIAVGMRVVLDTVQLDPGADTLTNLFGAGAQWLTAVMLLAGAALLLIMNRRREAQKPEWHLAGNGEKSD